MISVLIHFVLIQQHYASTIIICFDPYIDFFTLNLSLLDFSRLFISKFLQFLQTVLLHNIKLYFSRKGIKTMTWLIDLQSYYSFFTWHHSYCELIELVLVLNCDVFSLFKWDCLAEVVVVGRVVGVVVVYVACYWTCGALDLGVLCVLEYSLFLCKLLMKYYYLVEKSTHVQHLTVLNKRHWMLSVKIKHNLP